MSPGCVGTLSGRHGEIADTGGERYHGDRVKMYNDVFQKIFRALFGCKAEVPDDFRGARLLHARITEMVTRIDNGDFDDMCAQNRPDLVPCRWARSPLGYCVAGYRSCGSKFGWRG